MQLEMLYEIKETFDNMANRMQNTRKARHPSNSPRSMIKPSIIPFAYDIPFVATLLLTVFVSTIAVLLVF